MERKLSLGEFYGQVKMSRRVAGHILTETSYRSHFNIPSHSHDHTYICFCFQGVLAENYGRKSRTCEASSMTYHPPGEVHSGSFHGGGGRLFNIQIDPQWMQRVQQDLSVQGESIYMRGATSMGIARRLYQEFHYFDEASPLAIEGLLLETLAEVSRRSAPRPVCSPPRWLEQARELLHAEFFECPTLGKIAESVGVHPVHLSAAFRKHYQCTPGEYLRRLRIEFACHKLSTSDDPLSMIAAAAGFSDQSHFSKTFKLMTGMTPIRYKRLIRPT